MRVLVLRPREAGQRTAARLHARGHRAVLAPVIEVAPSSTPAPAGPFDALVLTSASALAAPLPMELLSKPVIAVGRRTAEAARGRGFTDVRTAEGDRQALAALAAQVLPRGSRLLLALGRDHKEDTARLLAAAGHEPVVWIAYEAEAVAALPDQGREALATGAADAALHYSRRSASVALALAERAGLRDRLLGLIQICLSADVAEPLREAGAGRLLVAARPDEEGLFAALDAAAGERRGV